MTWTAISAILPALGLIFLEWVRSRHANESALDKKNEALEEQAAEAREEEQAEDEAEAAEIIASGDRQRAIGFLRGSFSSDRAGKDAMPTAPVAGSTSP